MLISWALCLVGCVFVHAGNKFKVLPVLQYLLHVKDELSSVLMDNGKIVHAVMGNEAGDLDSLAAAISLAALRHAQSHGRLFVIPIYNIPRAEFGIYRDNLEVLNKSQIPESAILCRDDVPLEMLVASKRLHLTLVDHNDLSPRQDLLASAVVSIVDHHIDSGTPYPMTAPHDRYIRVPLGSTNTLTWMLMRSAGDTGSSLLEDSSLSLLTASAIIMDTGNLESASTTTDEDRHALGQLLPVCESLLKSTPHAWFKTLKKKREDVSGLTFLEVMVKDLKYARGASEIIAIGSVKNSLGALLASTNADRKEVISTIQNRLSQHHLHTFYALLRVEASGDKLLLVITQQRCWPKLAGALAEKLSEVFQIGDFSLAGYPSPWEGSELDDLQPALFVLTGGVSRKQVLPYLQKFHADGHANVCDVALTLGTARRTLTDL